jgi:hypothetical protein
LPVIEVGFLGLPGLTGSPRDALIAVGPGIIVDIGFDPIIAQVSAGAPVQPPPPPGTPNVNRVLALIDTGATQSCIDETLARQLQLPLVNQQNAAGVGGVHVLNVPGVCFVSPFGACAGRTISRRATHPRRNVTPGPDWKNFAGGHAVGL